MHICFLTQEYPKKSIPHGGIGTFVQSLARQLVRNGCIVSVIGINNENIAEEENDQGVSVYRLKKGYSIKWLQAFENVARINKKIKQINRKNPIHIIEANEAGLALIKKIPNIRYVIRMHGGHHFFTLFENRKKEPIKVWLEKKSFRKADNIVAVSKYVANITFEQLNINNREVKIIYNPVDTKKFRQVDYTKSIANSLLFVGSICEKKGIRQLVQAIPIIKLKFPDVTLKIVGRDWFFPNGKSYLEYLKTFINDDIKNAIHIVGSVPNTEIPRFIEETELCVYPSHMEAMPLAWLEVLSMGKPFVASNIGPGYEAITNNKTGLLCDPHNPQDIAEKVTYMLENKEKAIEMGRNARLDILKRFELKILTQQNINFYQNILKSTN